ncbi:hypothetical protein PT974_11550 [Cladobotryum mycophilum]|uniref:Uncharacterized protein n=1 Tax=Cladobotryum mycophilum TaxID=491253 RepID=A0ABR0S5J1_9HYPO
MTSSSAGLDGHHHHHPHHRQHRQHHVDVNPLAQTGAQAAVAVNDAVVSAFAASAASVEASGKPSEHAPAQRPATESNPDPSAGAPQPPPNLSSPVDEPSQASASDPKPTAPDASATTTAAALSSSSAAQTPTRELLQSATGEKTADAASSSKRPSTPPPNSTNTITMSKTAQNPPVTPTAHTSYFDNANSNAKTNNYTDVTMPDAPDSNAAVSTAEAPAHQQTDPVQMQQQKQQLAVQIPPPSNTHHRPLIHPRRLLISTHI